MKYKVIFRQSGYYDTVIGTYSSKKKAIESGSKYHIGHYSCDNEKERKIGLELRGWCIIGYTSNEICIEEIE